MYNVVPTRYTSGAAVSSYIVLALIIAVLAGLAYHDLVSDADRRPAPILIIGFLYVVLLALLGILMYGVTEVCSSPARVNYDVTALGRESVFSVSKSYVTARSASQALGRPVGAADVSSCYPDGSFRDDSRPVTYLADDGTIRQGTMKFDRAGAEWKAALYDLKGSMVPRPSHEVGSSAALTADSSGDMNAIIGMADNGADDCSTKPPIQPTSGHYDDAETVQPGHRTASMTASDGSTVRISSNGRTGEIIMEDSSGFSQPVHVAILNGKAYAIPSGSHSGKPIVAGNSGSPTDG